MFKIVVVDLGVVAVCWLLMESVAVAETRDSVVKALLVAAACSPELRSKERKRSRARYVSKRHEDNDSPHLTVISVLL